jgi:hypothetical protein
MRRLLPQLARLFLGVALLGGICLIASRAWFTSPREALAYLRGEDVSLEPEMLDFGNGHNLEGKSLPMTVRNWTGRVVRIVGGTADCSCVVTEGLPTDIGPGEAKEIWIRLVYPRTSTGIFEREARLYTADSQQRTLLVRLTGRVEGE